MDGRTARKGNSELVAKDDLRLMIYTAPAFAFLVIAMAWSTPPPAPDESGDDAAGAAPPPLAEIARLAEQGKLDGVTIEYWVGGGLPPPLYRSDQFRLRTEENRDILELARPFHDPATRLEGLVEKFQLAAQPADVRRMAKLILDTGVFDRHFPEEKEAGRADALTTEVIVRLGGREFKRRYFTGSPKPLAPLRTEIQRLIQRLEATGARRVFRQGKPVTLPHDPPQASAGGAEPTPEAIPLSKLAAEVGRRIERRLVTKGRLVLWLNVSQTATDPVQTAAEAMKHALQGKRGLVFSTRTVAGAVPIPSGTPGGHVHMSARHPAVISACARSRGTSS